MQHLVLGRTVKMWLPRVLGVVFALGVPVFALAQTAGNGRTMTCQEVSGARPGSGVAYKNQVENADYGFVAKIPDGLTAWGAGPGAPFHGFIIYLNQKACINFEVGIDVELPEDGREQAAGPLGVGHKMRVGNRSATRTTSTGTINGVGFENIWITLELLRRGQRNHVEITLIAPVMEKAGAEAKLQEFIDHLRFM
jgi:hypothetical protein